MPCDYCSCLSVCNGVLCINIVEELSFYGILVSRYLFIIYGFTSAGDLDCNIANATHILEYVLNTRSVECGHLHVTRVCMVSYC